MSDCTHIEITRCGPSPPGTWACSDCGERMHVDVSAASDPSTWPTECPSEPGWYWCNRQGIVQPVQVTATDDPMRLEARFPYYDNGDMMRPWSRGEIIRWRPGAIRP